MTVSLDAQLPPALAPWLTQTLSIEANAVRDLGLSYSKPVNHWSKSATLGKSEEVSMFFTAVPQEIEIY